MKIGLLAYHSAINFGATLQLLSTYSYLKNHGYEPIIINWVAEDLDQEYSENAPKQQREAQEALRKQIWHETSLCRNDEDVARVIQEEGIEAVIIGSDAVCQHHTKRERTVFPCRRIVAVEHATSDRLFPNPFWATWNRLLPEPVPVCVLSASNQDSKYEYFSKSLCKEMAESVSGYSFLSVRDTWTQQMFRHITKGKVVPEVTPDPVFAFSHNASAIIPSKEEIMARYNLPDRYILMSFINSKVVSQEWIDSFCSLAKADGIECVKLPFSHTAGFGKYTKEIPLPLSPIDWFALIKYSCGYVGNNMHPIVVSIHNAVPFFCFDNYGLKRFNGLITSDSSSKIKHILETAGLADYRVSCISRTFKLPDASTVYDKLRGFNTTLTASFAKEYYAKYLKMMERIETTFKK